MRAESRPPVTFVTEKWRIRHKDRKLVSDPRYRHRASRGQLWRRSTTSSLRSGFGNLMDQPLDEVLGEIAENHDIDVQERIAGLRTDLVRAGPWAI